MAYLFVAVIVFVVCFFVFRSEERKKEAQRAHREELEPINANFTYKPEKEQLVVLKRCPDNAKVFRIQDYKRKNYSDVPAKLVYTGATVGGVTTGGVHISGGYTTVSNGMKSGKCILQYIWYDGDTLYKGDIKTIRFGEGITYAGSPIAKYVRKNRIIVVEDEAKRGTAVALGRMGASARSSATLNIYESAKIDDYPTEEKCVEIVSWLCGID